MILVDTDYFALETKSFIFSDFIINNIEGHKFLQLEHTVNGYITNAFYLKVKNSWQMYIFYCRL